MRQALHSVAYHVSKIFPAPVPLALLCSSTLSSIVTPFRHSLFVTSVAWFLAAIYYGSRAGTGGENGRMCRRKLCCLAGILYTLGQICERVTLDRESFWWSKALLPLCTYCILQCGPLDNENGWSLYAENNTQNNRLGSSRSFWLITLTAALGLAVLASIWVSPPNIVLGLCGSLATAGSLVLLEEVLRTQKHERSASSADGLLQRSPSSSSKEQEEVWIVMRNMALAVAAFCLVASLSLENFQVSGLTYRPESGIYDSWGARWKARQYEYNIETLVSGIILETLKAITLLSVDEEWQIYQHTEPHAFILSFRGLANFNLFMTRDYGTLCASFVSVGAILITKLLVFGITWSALWMTSLYGAITYLIFEDAPQSPSVLPMSWRRMRTRQLVTLLAVATLVFVTHSYFRRPQLRVNNIDFPFPTEPPIESLQPLRLADTSSHPINQLIEKSEDEFNRLLARQSKTLDEAVAEYKRRYHIPPPPNFDIWYGFAKRKDVQLIDEYDTIYHSLLPFWALEPSAIRSRVAEALGFDGNFLMALKIRQGEAVIFEGGEEWDQRATLGMIREFVQYLPDMDLAFNIHDEPRVIVPHDTLSQLVSVALNERIPAAFATKEPKNMFSSRPFDVTDGKRVQEVGTTRFNSFAHQHTWTHSRMSCSPESPARNYEGKLKDNVTAYALSDLGFVYNHSAFNDICFSPSLQENFGFFDRPNAFNIVQDLFPIFSQSKISSYQDILYPSPWYWAGKVEYEDQKDTDWPQKETRLYWRGSTTGGFSRNGGWRRQHRQRVVRKLNQPDNAKIFANMGTPDAPDWQPLEVRRKDYEEIVDVKFSHVGQCDPNDCDAQMEFFDVVERVDQQDAWQFKYLLDVDGNAFSGRFYAFLKSNSLIFKMSLFQEWHKDWLKPWVHYIPLSLRGDEWLEAVRYFVEEEGKKDAPRLAALSKDWANKSLRNEDLEVWFFRLLLEYGRLIDDNRETIGYPGP